MLKMCTCGCPEVVHMPPGTGGCGNCVECWEFTLAAVEPPTGESTSAELRRVEQAHGVAIARLHAVHDTMTRIDDGDTEEYNTPESTAEYVVGRYRAVVAAEEEAAGEIDRLRGELRAIAELADLAAQHEERLTGEYSGAVRDHLRESLDQVRTRARQATALPPVADVLTRSGGNRRG
jgi:hypothetical protein